MKGRLESSLVSYEAVCSLAESHRVVEQGSGDKVPDLTRPYRSSRGIQREITPPFSNRESHPIIACKQLEIIRVHSSLHRNGEHPRSQTVLETNNLEIEA